MMISYLLGRPGDPNKITGLNCQLHSKPCLMRDGSANIQLDLIAMLSPIAPMPTSGDIGLSLIGLGRF